MTTINEKSNKTNDAQITNETRRESYKKIKPDALLRRNLVMKILNEHGPMTAQGISTILCMRGYTTTPDRNFSSPRLTELQKMGCVRAIEKETCNVSGRKVAVWDLTEKCEKN